MKNLSATWQKLILWLTGYVSIVAFILAGGYFYKNTEDKKVKTTAKVVLVLTAVFTALGIVVSILNNIATIADNYDIMNTASTMSAIFSLVKIVTFVTLFILDLCGIDFIPKKQSESTEE